MPDIDRPLNKRGFAEAEAMGKLLLEQELVPDLLLASPARRTQQTTEILARTLTLTPRRLKAIESLYLAPQEDILALIQATGPKVQHLAVVGHNPGLSDLARHLAPAGVAIAGLATGAACTLTFTTRSWAYISPPAARVAQFEPPTTLFSLFT